MRTNEKQSQCPESISDIIETYMNGKEQKVLVFFLIFSALFRADSFDFSKQEKHM